MNDKIKGLVLTINDYKETDVLMKVLTFEYGVLTFIAKASKKLTSKNHFLANALYEFIIDYKEDKTIYNVRSTKLLKNYFEDKDLYLASLKNILIELCLKNNNINTYQQILFVDENIDQNNMYLLVCLFLSYLIKEEGICPVVDNCVKCTNKKVVAISNEQGGFLCLEHLSGEQIVSVDSLKKFRLIIKADFKHFDLIKDFKYSFNDFSTLMDFYLYNSSVVINSYDFYKKLL